MASTDGFEVELEARGEELWVLPRGDLDLATTPEMRESLGLALRSDADAVVVDLRGLGLLDSTGLKALVEAHAGPEGHRVSFVPGNELIAQVLQVSHLDGELRFRAAE
jgi:anti-sigma B factor antagonist